MGMDGGNPAVPSLRCCHHVRPWQCHLPPSASTPRADLTYCWDVVIKGNLSCYNKTDLENFFVFSPFDVTEVPKAFPVFLLFDTAEQCTDSTKCICFMATEVSELQ